MTHDRAIELLRGMQTSILNTGRLRSLSHAVDASRVEAMDIAISAIRLIGSVSVSTPEIGSNAQERSAEETPSNSHPSPAQEKTE